MDLTPSSSANNSVKNYFNIMKEYAAMWYEKKRLELLVMDNEGLRTEVWRCHIMENSLLEITSPEMLDRFMPTALELFDDPDITLCPHRKKNAVHRVKRSKS